MINTSYVSVVIYRRATHFSFSWQSYHLSSPTRFTKNVKNYTKICKFCNIIVEARWDKFFFNLKYNNILSQCCYWSKGYSFESLMAELSPLESYTIYQNVKNDTKIYKIWNIIVEAWWKEILFKFKIQQHPKPVLLFIKGLLIWVAHGRVITFRVLRDLQKTWKNSTKICKFCKIIVEARWD